MAWYPGATRMELQPESDQQPAIRPTQFIVHSVVAPWDEQRIYAYWRDSNLESHFGLDYDGSMGQYIGTETRADANAGANRRADGTGAVSVETASNTKASDPWTAAQVEALIRLGVWLHQRHGIPLQICRTHSDKGFGYHSLYSQWSTSGTACPGAARIAQFREVVFPGIVARATGTPIEEDPMAGMTKADIYAAVWKTDAIAAPKDAPDAATNTMWQPQSYLKDTNTRARAIQAALAEPQPVTLTDAQIQALATHPALAEAIAEQVAAKLADRLAS